MSLIEIVPHKIKDPTFRPLLGSANCGLFGISEDYTESYLSLDELMVKNREATFFFIAESFSMAPVIVEGDILIVDCSKTAKNNDIIVANLNGERVCKRLVKQQGRVILLSENKKIRPIVISEEMDFVVFGPVTGIARMLP